MTDSGYVLYDGPSGFDGQRIVAIACSLNSVKHNRKTGSAVQTYIFRADAAPSAAANLGNDRSVCGDCPLRPMTSGVCYVQLGTGTHWAYQKWATGGYSALPNHDVFSGKFVRLGTYGDPAAIPFDIWKPIVQTANNWAGYTHQWRTCDQSFREICMASVESWADAILASDMGWRTFRVRLPGDELLESEIVCPSSEEGGGRRKCETCKACRGTKQSASARSVSIVIHGRPWKQAQFARIGLLMAQP